MKYDYCIVGSGLFGAVFAHKMAEHSKKCLVVEKRNHIAGNIYTEKIEDIDVHKYGAHIFHTNNEQVWSFITKFVKMNNFINSPVANWKGELYNLPFNMNTFYQMWKVVSPEEAIKKINEQIKENYTESPRNLEEKALNLVGKDIYQKLIKGYTEKQWGRDCKDLPASIINRIPVRLIFDNNYFNAKWQGIPEEGYTALVERLLEDIPTELGVDYISNRNELNKIADKIVFTGPIDEYFDFCFGALNYRRVTFKNELLNKDNYQGVAVMNFTDEETPYTRIIEHKHFNNKGQQKTYISYEYPAEWKLGEEPFYPINDEKNSQIYKKYEALAAQELKTIFGGRLGQYRYFDMDRTIEEALKRSEQEIKGKIK